MEDSKIIPSKEELVDRLKKVKQLKQIMLDALKVDERDLRLYRHSFKPMAGDDKVIAEIKADILRIDENLQPIIAEECSLIKSLKAYKQSTPEESSLQK